MEVTSDALNFQLVDFYPSLRILYKVLPGWVLPSKRKLHNLQKLENRVFYDLLGKAKERLEAGEAHPSLYHTDIVNCRLLTSTQVLSAIC
jgi:hypothetical protein